MKKVAFLFVFAALLLGLTGCESKECKCEPQQPCQFHKKTIDLVVNQNDWIFDQSAQQFFYHFDIDELTKDVYNYAEISISHEYNPGTNQAYQVMLPETMYQSVEEDMGDGTTQIFNYAEHIDYIYGIGWVELFFTVSDFVYPTGYTPATMVFRVQMTY